jgi:hypothetical protein
VGEREKEGELTSVASTTTAAAGRGLDGGAMARLAAQRVRRARTRRQRRHSDGAGDAESEGEARRSGVGRETRHSGEENCASGEEIVRRAKKSCVWRFQGDEQGAPDTRARLERRRRTLLALGACAQGALAALGHDRGAGPAGHRALGRQSWAAARARLARASAGSWAEQRAGPRGRELARGGGEAGAGPPRCAWAHEGALARVGRGEKREGGGGTAGPAELGQGGSWAEIHFSFSFLFLSLFYLFQFDTMRKQMMR